MPEQTGPKPVQTTILTEAQLTEAFMEAAREERRLTSAKKDYDGKANNLIGIEQKKQTAILEEIDQVKAGRTEDLPFSDRDWSSLVKSRNENV
jgi:hypothetical protein